MSQPNELDELQEKLSKLPPKLWKNVSEYIDTLIRHVEQDETLTHLASEKVLAQDWLNEEEDKAWEDL